VGEKNSNFIFRGEKEKKEEDSCSKGEKVKGRRFPDGVSFTNEKERRGLNQLKRQLKEKKEELYSSSYNSREKLTVFCLIVAGRGDRRSWLKVRVQPGGRK